ncbi:alpha/beta hydrolase [Actinoallomurus soli]|uniref:alpha/beta hydrolase n=1 Tax=Actinoallomurus soli TaxID=2952535 RepID=UPI0020925683|nr:alpha/beta hydrolase-fold protein [Actinoallomurus soli]MCO5973714.1 alpha/beta hydrolase-fold protein [Actinoallomurus soli]
MSLLGPPLLVLSILLALAAPVGCALLWGRVRGMTAWPVRIAMIVVCQVTAVLLAGVGLNDHFQFFASWNDLIGQNGADAPIQQQNSGSQPLARGLSKRLRNDFRPDRRDSAYSAELVGAKSGIRSRIWVWLPPQYRQRPRQRFPVIELFPGFPGTPITWFHTMQGPKKLQEAMKKGAAQPYILVAPTITVVPGHDTECTNVPGGPKVATWLTEDVRRIVMENFRALPGRDGWGTMGYSTGGYCAAKLATEYPRLFRAGVSMSGYFTASNPALARVPGADVPALLQTRHPNVDLLLTASKQDPGTTTAVNTMVRAARPPSVVYTYVVPRGGHNTGVWTAMLPKCFQWLTTQLTHAD